MPVSRSYLLPEEIPNTDTLLQYVRFGLHRLGVSATMDGAMKLGKPAVVVEARGNTRVTHASYLARWRAIPRLVLLDTG